MSLQGTHDLKRVVLAISARRITGFGASDAVAVAFDEQRYSKGYGADGEAGRSAINAKGGTITVTVAQTNHEAVKYLDSLAVLVAPLDVFPISFTDINSGQAFIAAQCWLQKEPDKSWAKEGGDFVYVFDAAEIRFL